MCTSCLPPSFTPWQCSNPRGVQKWIDMLEKPSKSNETTKLRIAFEWGEGKDGEEGGGTGFALISLALQGLWPCARGAALCCCSSCCCRCCFSESFSSHHWQFSPALFPLRLSFAANPNAKCSFCWLCRGVNRWEIQSVYGRNAGKGKWKWKWKGRTKPKKGNSLRGLQLMAEQIVSKNNFMHKERKYISS